MIVTHRNRALFLTISILLCTIFPKYSSGQNRLIEPLKNALNSNNPSEFLSEYKKLEPLFGSNDSLGIYANEAVAKYFQSKSTFGQSIQFHKQALLYYRKRNTYLDSPHIDQLFCLSSIAFLYLKLNDTINCKSYLDTCLSFAESSENDFYQVHAFNNMGLYHSRIKQYDSALYYFQHSLLFVGKSYNDSVLFGSISGNIARVHTALGNYKSAYKFYLLNLKNSKLLNEREDYCQTAVGSVSTLVELQKLEEATVLLQSVKTEVFEDYKAIINEWLYAKALLEEVSQGDSAKYWLSESQKYSAGLIKNQGIEINRVLNDMMDKKIELTTTEQQLQQAERDRLNKKSIIRIQQIAFILLLTLFIAVVGLLWYHRKVLKNEKQLITEQLKTDLAKQQLENETLKNEHLDLALQHKSRDVTTLAIDIHDKHKLQYEWAKKLKKLRGLRDKDQLRSAIDELLRQVEQNQRIDKEKVPLKEKVEEVNSAFYEKLLSQFPKLTKSERELCGMIRLNMNTKEIATLKNITPGSAKVMKHRLRKKLELTTHYDLHLFMAKL